MATSATFNKDERVTEVSLAQRLLRLPEVGALMGAFGVALLFSLIAPQIFPTIRGMARVLDPTSTIGIMAIAMALLMIGGEFDLSIGVMTGTTGLIVGMLTVNGGLPLIPAMFISLIFALAVGYFNAYMRIRTGLPSFIITLGTMFFLRGANIGVTHIVTNQVRVAGLDKIAGFEVGRAIFNQTFTLGGAEFRTTIFWWIGITLICTWILLRTAPGSWVFATGGDEQAARSVGVPVDRVKVALFMWAHFCAWLVGMMIMFRLRSALASQGVGQEFVYLVASVTGGNRMTGGYGSVIGASIGATIFGMTRVGIVFAGWNTNWFFSFVGIMLLLAVLLNLYTQRRSEQVQVSINTEDDQLANDT